MDETFFKNNKFTHKVRKFIIADLIKKYRFLSFGVIGRSLCARSIDYIGLGNKKNMNLWVCAHHGIEWLTSLVVLKFLRSVCENIKNEKKICGIDLKKSFGEKGLMIIPCLNPDGVDISLQGPLAAGNFFRLVEKVSKKDTSHWQANARGVDLNHNYSAGWHKLHKLEIENGILGPSKTRYGGIKPISEPETMALTSFCLKNNFSSAVAFHSQGEEIYWNYGEKTPKESLKIANILALASGYKVSTPEGLAVGGGFKDWFIEKFERPAFTIEIGKGKNPLSVSNLGEIYSKIENMLYIASII